MRCPGWVSRSQHSDTGWCEKPEEAADGLAAKRSKTTITPGSLVLLQAACLDPVTCLCLKVC